MHDGVDHAVVEQELGRLESFRQILAERLLDHARTGEPDHRARLGEDRVAEHRVAGAHAARRRVGEDRDVRNAALGELREHRRHLRHLHQREHAFLHARAARGADDDQRILPLERPLAEARDLLADHGAHRAAHEREVHDAEVDRQRVERAACAASSASRVAGVRRSPSSGGRDTPESRAGRSTGGRPRPPRSCLRRGGCCSSRSRECDGDSRSSGRR